MSKKLVIGIMAVLLLSTISLGGLFAQAGTGGVSISTSGTAASGATITTWSVGNPAWSPIEGAVGTIDGGGIARVHVPSSPAGKWAITLYLDDPNELVGAYSYWNPSVQIRTLSTSVLASGSSAIPTVGGSGNADASTFTGGTEVSDAQTSDLSQILTLEKGYVTFTVNSSDGVPVDASDVYATGGENRVFEIGISTPTGTSNAGTFYTKDASTADSMSPEFTIEVSQR